MKVRIALGICLAIAVFCCMTAGPYAVFFSAASNRAINPGHVLNHSLSLIWLWSLVALPILVGLSYTSFRGPVVAAMATVIYTPIYIVWASFFAGPHGLVPDRLSWIVMPLVVLGFEFVLVVRLRELSRFNISAAETSNPAPSADLSMPQR